MLFLDEPTTGLDPRSRLGMWDVIRSLVADGTTLLLTTQYLDEADELADEIVVIDHGLVIAAGTSEELKSRVGGDVLEFSVPDRARIGDAVAAIAKIGESEPHVDEETGVITIGVGGRGSEALIEAVRALDSAGVPGPGPGAAPPLARRRVPGADRARRGRRGGSRRPAAAAGADPAKKDTARSRLMTTITVPAALPPVGRSRA